MSQRERRQAILEYLDRHNTLDVDQAVTLFNASPATVRRDFVGLTAEGLAEKTRGGVRRLQVNLGEMVPYLLREGRQSAAKAAIARHAASLLKDGDVVMIDGGTSTFHLAEYLPPLALRVVTNSLRLAAYFAEHDTRTARLQEVILTGGTLYPHSYLLAGRQAKYNLEQYYADVAFLSVGGIASDGITNTNERVVESEQVIIDHSSRVIVLADHSKIGRRAMCRVAGLDRIDLLITDEHPDSAATLQELRQLGLTVVTVSVGDGDGDDGPK